jgi:outer membrane protein assembly factor BamD
LLAENSVEDKRIERYQSALDEYYSFMDEFPESEFKREADRIYRATSQVLKLDDVASNNE